MGDIALSHPLLLFLLLLPWLWRRFVPPYRQRHAALRVPFFDRIAEEAGLKVEDGAVVVAHKRRALIVGGIIWALVVVALAGPVRLGPPQEVTKATRDVILAIDISGSMDAVDFPGEDGKPIQRLAAVQEVVEAFLNDRTGDRIALIVFGSRAYVQAPLTEDLDTVKALLLQTEVGMAGPHTALGDAIGLAIRTFEASEIEERLLVLLSDGNDTASRMSPLNAAEIARDKGVRMFAVGVGDPDASGEDRLDMALLSSLAKRTGGDGFFAADADALEHIYDEIDALSPREEETLSWRTEEPLAHWPLSAALLAGLGLLLSLWARAKREIAV